MITIRKFSSPTCNPCKILGAILEGMDLKEMGAKVEEVDVSSQEGAVLAAEHEIMSVPVLHFIRNGSIVADSKGLIGGEEIEDLINYAKEAK